MELVNQTAVPAQLLVADMPDEGCRGGLLVAKASFDVSAGPPRLAADPLPVLGEPAPLGDLGELPEDLLPREDPAFEVFLLGACHTPGGEPARQAMVGLCVGAAARQLLVTGDRTWVGSGPSATIGPPAAFTRLPLSFERAFGGSAEVRIDPHSTYPVFDPLNARGRGFDAAAYLAGCAAAFECPPGFPALASAAPRPLPNVEDPEQRIRAWGDHPPPACWATIPRDVGFGAQALSARLARYGQRATRAQQAQAAYFRAHPGWTLDAPPPARAPLRLDGLRAQGPLTFGLPALRVLADYELGGRVGVLELRPQALVLLPEQLRFCLVYRSLFRFDAAPAQARSFRLRLAEGWAPPPAADARGS